MRGLSGIPFSLEMRDRKELEFSKEKQCSVVFVFNVYYCSLRTVIWSGRNMAIASFCTWFLNSAASAVVAGFM